MSDEERDEQERPGVEDEPTAEAHDDVHDDIEEARPARRDERDWSDRDWGAPAPVVTDQGVYGTLPERRREAFRDYRRRERPVRDTWMRLAGAAFAITAGLWLVVFSASQSTSEEVARPALESLVDTMVGLPGLLDAHEATISAASGDATVPGYPLPVTIPAADVPAGPDRWREVVLEQSSAILYVDGPEAFADGEDTGGGGTFSTSGGTRLLMNNLSASRHDSFGFLIWPLGIAAVVAATAILATGAGFGRFVALGLATAAAGLPAIALGVLSWGIVLFIGSDGSALAEAGHAIASDLAWLPIRNGLTLLVAGIAVTVAARVVGAIFRAAPTPAPALEPDWE